MIRILKLVLLLVVSQVAFAQAPSNYTNINGRYRWIAGMFDSTFHIPKGSTPSLRTGGSTNAGGLFYNTADSSVYTYTGTQWIKVRGSINPLDTTNKYVTQVYKKNGSDSVFYVKGGIHTWAFNDSTGAPGGGGGGKIYYLNGGVSMGTFGGFTMYELGDTANTGTAANFTRATTGNIANFITDVNKPGLLQIPAGVWSIDAWLSESGGGSNHAEIYAAVEKWNGSTITTIATSPIEEITEGSSPNLYTWSVSIPTTTIAVTDRIIIQFYIQNTNGKTVTLYTQNGYVGEVHTTFTTGIGAINGLTAPAQYLVTGTSGTDFNISSSTATHTFNLPTASATNRGALSSSNWTTFNNKIGPSDTASMLSPYLRSNVAVATYVPYSGAIASLDMGLFNVDAQNVASKNYVTGVTMSAITRSDATAAAYGVLYLKRSANGYLQPTTLSLDRTWTLPDKNGTVALTSDLTGGTVTSVATNTNTGITGGTITTSGTLAIDTLRISTRAWRQKGVDSVAGLLSGYVPTSRTLTINGTSYDLSANRSWSVGTVTSVATNTGTGITGGTITSSGTIAADTLLLSTRAWRQKGIDSVAALISSNISGTTNYIPKFTSSSAIGNSVIYEASGSVGINLTNLSSYNLYNGLGVKINNGYGMGLISSANTDNAYLAFGYGTTAAQQYAAYFGRIGGDNLAFGIANAEQMRLTSTGLGVGTSSPTEKLEISGSNAMVKINASGSFAQLGYYNSGSFLWNAYADISSSEYRLGNSGGTRLTLTSGGNLGLGVTPSAWSGKAMQVVNSSLGDVASSLQLTYNGYFDGTNWRYLTSAAATNYYQASGSHIWRTAPSGTAGNAISFTQAMTLTSGGLLGIGATNPTRSLQITRTSTAFINAEGSNVAMGSSDAELRLFGNNTETMTLKSGNVGIGTTSPTQLLDVNGTAKATTLTDGFITISSAQINRTSATVEMQFSGSGGVRIFGNTSYPVYFQEGTGRVGIGTTSPTLLFEVVGQTQQFGSSTAYRTARFTSTTAVNADRPGIILGYDINGGGVIAGATENNGQPINFWTYNGSSWGERMRITSGGNVGIGTTSPSGQLHLNGSANLLMTNTANTSGFEIGLLGGTSDATAYIYQRANSAMIFATNNSERMRITSAGELLINTTSDAGDYKLQVNGNAYISNQLSVGNTNFVGTGGAGYIFTNIYGLVPNNTANANNRNWALQANGQFNGSLDFVSSSANNSFPNDAYRFSITRDGAIQTNAPSGGTAKPWKLGEGNVTIGGSDGKAVRVEIDGTLYYLMTGYLPEPEPEAQAGPSMGYKAKFEEPVIKIKSDNQKIKDLEKEIAELKELIKTKIK